MWGGWKLWRKKKQLYIWGGRSCGFGKANGGLNDANVRWKWNCPGFFPKQQVLEALWCTWTDVLLVAPRFCQDKVGTEEISVGTRFATFLVLLSLKRSALSGRVASGPESELAGQSSPARKPKHTSHIYFTSASDSTHHSDPIEDFSLKCLGYERWCGHACKSLALKWCDWSCCRSR